MTPAPAPGTAARRHWLRRQRVLSCLQAAAWWWRQAEELRAGAALRERTDWGFTGARRSLLYRRANEAAQRAAQLTREAWREAAYAHAPGTQTHRRAG